MAEPVIRETYVDEELLLKAENIVNNFPKYSGTFTYDIERYRENSKVLNKLIEQRNLPNDSSDIDTSKYLSGETFLIVKLNLRVEKVIKEFIKLQSDYLDEILGK